ncbi:AAA family ATPase [Leptospira sp. WS60.C2]
MKSNRPTLHFLCGKMASGKTTLSKKIAKEENALLFCEDIWLQRLYPEEIKDFEDYKKYSARLKTILTDHIQQVLQNGNSVVLDFPANIPKTRNWIRNLFESTNANHLLHLIELSDEECLQQLQKRNLERPEGSVPMTEEEFHMITSYYSPPTKDEGFQIKVYTKH